MNLTKRIYQIGDYRGRLHPLARPVRQHCYCEALHSRQEFFAAELRDLHFAGVWPHILRLESLESGIPANPSPAGSGWDLIYSSELLTGLPAIAARQVIRIASSKLNPGGRLLFANVSLNTQVRQCCECGGPGQTYRSALELAGLTRDIPGFSNTGQAVFLDNSGLNAYLELYRPV